MPTLHSPVRIKHGGLPLHVWLPGKVQEILDLDDIPQRSVSSRCSNCLPSALLPAVLDLYIAHLAVAFLPSVKGFSVDVVSRVIEAPRRTTPLGVLTPGEVHLAGMRKPLAEFLVAEGARMCHGPKDCEEILHVVRPKLEKAERQSWTMRLYLGGDDEGAANGCLHVVVELGWDELAPVPPVEDERQVRHARQPCEELPDAFHVVEQDVEHALDEHSEDLFETPQRKRKRKRRKPSFS